MKNNSQKGNGVIVMIVVIGLIWGAYSIFSKNDSADNNYDYNSYDSSYDYDSGDSDYYTNYGNPYNEGSGHYAGYEWAEQNGVSSCGGNSNSFIEGCEEYLNQQGY